MGPKPPPSTVLPQAEEALMVTFRRQTLRPLDDGLYAVPSPLPHLTRSALHRGVKRHGSGRVPAIEGDTPPPNPCKRDPIGDCPSEMAAVRTEEGQLALLVASDRAGQLAYAERPAAAHHLVAAPCLRNLRAARPDKRHTGLTDHGSQVTKRQRDIDALQPIVDRVGHAQGIAHRLTTTHHPWTNGQVARRHRTLPEASGRPSDDETHAPLPDHLYACLMASTFATRLNTLKGLTPYAYICQGWPKDPARFTRNPCHHTLGLNS
jgi:hypothetical protein